MYKFDEELDDFRPLTLKEANEAGWDIDEYGEEVDMIYSIDVWDIENLAWDRCDCVFATKDNAEAYGRRIFGEHEFNLYCRIVEIRK